MAPTPKSIADTLRARGVRKTSARRVAEAIGDGSQKSTPKAVARVAADLRRRAADLEAKAGARTRAQKSSRT